MVFYFTATGNSLYAARQLDANVMSIPQVMRRSCLRRFADEAIGVVYPIFGHRRPSSYSASCVKWSWTRRIYT